MTRGYLDDALNRAGDWAGLPLDALAFQVARSDPDGRWLIAVDAEDRATQLVRALRFFHPKPHRVAPFPADDTRPYDGFGPERWRPQARMRALQRVEVGGPVLIVASAAALLQRVPTRQVRQRGTRVIEPEMQLDRDELVRWLADAGYLSVPAAELPGSFAVRGDVLDVWPAGSTRAVRLDFFDDEVESVRALESGRSGTILNRLLLLPAREERLDAQAADRAQVELARWVADQKRGMRLRRRVIEDVRDGVHFSGIEGWLPALVPTVAPLAVFRSLSAFSYEPGDVVSAARERVRSAQQRWLALEDDERPLVPPSERYDTVERFEAFVQGTRRVWSIAGDNALQFEIQGVEGFGVQGQELGPTARRIDQLLDNDARIAVVVENQERVAALESLLGPHQLTLRQGSDPLALPRGKLTVLTGDLPRGFVARESGWAFLPASVLFQGRSRANQNKRSRIHQLFERELTDLSQLKVGDHVVHSLHGVGEYLGLKRVALDGVAQDFVELRYLGGDRMFLPVTRMGQISRYSPGSNNTKVRLDRLGGQTWTKRKGKVRDHLLKMAQDLLKLYARREIATREPLEPPGPVYADLVGRFPFDETVDQLAAIDAVNDDLDRPFPMDRLLCGDVGFGKTEVALRAAMRMVENGRQVAILCPTTVLAYQHFTTWSERFEGLPVRVAMLSRFNNASTEKSVIKGLKAGEIDIVVGTTKLLGRSVGFDDLGMVIVDEEHRFGVKQKDRLKKLRTAVDILSMSATPIPRTLQLALGGVRDMSLMVTPPAGRLSVATSTARLGEGRVRDAILTELERGGQCFVVHNRVETIQRFAERLQKWVPTARFTVAHGQLNDEALERELVRFIEHEVDVLVCTAIIETGVDLPNVNTMLIDRADLFGLAQLYQLRGRVGRSSVRGRCLLLTPEEMNPEARKRVQVLVENTELGAGFRVASADLELRGGGNLLGAAQSGQIDQVGYEVWVELLEEAIHVARGEQVLEHIEPEVEVAVEAFIPQQLIPDMHERLGWYGRIANAPSMNAVERVLDDMEVLFGDLPAEVHHLAGNAQVTLQCRELGVARCSWLKIRVMLEFHPATKTTREDLDRVVRKHPKRFRVRGEAPLLVEVRFTPKEGERPYQYLRWVLAQI